MAMMMDDTAIEKIGRALSHPTGQMLPKPISMLTNPFTVSQIGIAFNRLKEALSDPACKVKALSEVKTGDHIVLRPKKANLVDKMMMGQHAIVQGVNRDRSTVLIIHYHSEVFKKKSNSQRLLMKSLVTGKVIQSKIRFDKYFNIYKINHKNTDSVQLVLERAKARLGEKDFNFFLNNDEHFAYFCKTGTPRSCRNKMYILKMAQFTVKLYCLGQSIYLMLGLNSGVATYFYRRTTRVKTHTNKETAIRAKEMAAEGVFCGFLNNWLLIKSTSASSRDFDTKDGNALQVAIPNPVQKRLRRPRQNHKFKPHPGEDKQKVMELGSQLVARAVGQTMAKSVAQTGAKHMAKQAMKKGIQSAAKKAGEKMAHHAGKSALHHAAKGAAVKTAVASASKSSGHGVAGALRAAARGQGLAIGMGALVSVGFATKDIMRAKKEIKEGAISPDQYNNVVTRKVAGATTDIAMGTYGAVMGTLMAGPVGAVVGGFMGSMVGSIVGEEIGEELDKNNMGLKWAAKEGSDQGKLAKITELKETSELPKDDSKESTGLKPETTACETDVNEKIPDMLGCKMQEELQPSAQITCNNALEASGEQNQERNPDIQESQVPVAELFGEYFDTLFQRKEKKEKAAEDRVQQSQSHTFVKGLWGSFFGNTEDEDEEEIVEGQSIDHIVKDMNTVEETSVESETNGSTGGLNQIEHIISSMPEVNQIPRGETGSEAVKTENSCLETNSPQRVVSAEYPSEDLATRFEVKNIPSADESSSLPEAIEKKEKAAEDRVQQSQSHTFVKGLWGSFFGNTEDEDEEEIVEGQSIDHIVKDTNTVEETSVESETNGSIGGLNQIEHIISSMPEVNQIPRGETGLEAVKTENSCLETNSPQRVVSAEYPSEDLATRFEVKNIPSADESSSLPEAIEAEQSDTETDDKKEVDAKDTPQGAVADPALQDQQKSKGFSFFGFGKTSFGKVISGIIQEIVLADDFVEPDKNTVGQVGEQNTEEGITAPGGGNAEESNKAQEAESEGGNRTARENSKENNRKEKTIEENGGPDGGNDEQINCDTEGEDSCNYRSNVTSDTDGEDIMESLVVTAVVHNKQNIFENTGMNTSLTTDQMMNGPMEDIDGKSGEQAGRCFEDIGNIPISKDSGAIISDECASTNGLTICKGNERDEKNRKCREVSASSDTMPVHSSEESDVRNIAMWGVNTTKEVSTDVIITIEEDDEEDEEDDQTKDEKTDPRIKETDYKAEETNPDVDETEPKVQDTEITAEETQPKARRSDHKVEANESYFEESPPEDEEKNMCPTVNCESEMQYMVDGDHLLPSNNLTDYYSITWTVEAEETGEVIDTGLIDDEMTLKNILKEFAQRSPNYSEGNINDQSGSTPNVHDSQTKEDKPQRKVGSKEKAD